MLALCEIWELGAMFGVGLEDDQQQTQQRPLRYSEGGQDPNLAARIARARGEDVPDVIVHSYHPKLGPLN